MLRIDGQLKLSKYQTIYDLVVPENHILRKIAEEIDFTFVNKMLEASYCKNFGRPAKEPEMMFKILFLKRMYDLSDEALIRDLGYNMAFKFFTGLAPEDKTIDSSLLTKFRKTRITEDMLEDMLTETIRQAIDKGLIKSRAIIVDSTHTYSKGNPETPTQILRRLTKGLRREIYQTQPELAECFPEKSQKNGIVVEEVLGDKAYSSKDNIDYCSGNNIKLVSRLNSVVSNGNSRDEEFIYNKDAGTMQCPEGHLAMRCDIRKGKYDNQYYTYCFSMKKCKKCVRYATCCKPGAKTKTHSITVIGETRGKQQEFEESEYFKERIKDRYKIEAKNAELKQAHGLSRCKYTGLFGMKIQMYFSAFVVNIKRMIRLKEIKTA